MKMIRVSLGSERRKEFTASRRVIASAMSPPSEGIHSASSSSETHGLFSPRFLVFLSRRRSSEALRVSLPRYVARFSGFCGGILFHAPTYASETHSLASSSQGRMPFAIAWQYLPYFFCVSSIAVSERAKNRSTIALSSIVSPPRSLFRDILHPYTRKKHMKNNGTDERI